MRVQQVFLKKGMRITRPGPLRTRPPVIFQEVHVRRAEGTHARRASRRGATGRHAGREWLGSRASVGSESGRDAITILLT